MSCESGHMEEPGFDDCTVPETNVSVYDALYLRRMAWDFKHQLVPRDALAGMLDTAIRAPNHRLTEPWRFFILEQGSRRWRNRRVWPMTSRCSGAATHSAPRPPATRCSSPR